MRIWFARVLVAWWAIVCVSPIEAIMAGSRAALSGEAGSAPQVWINAATGSDTGNNCHNEAAPCLTLAHLDTFHLRPRTIINLSGSFGAGDALALTTANGGNGLTIRAYGAGATINSGTSSECIKATNLGGISIIGTASHPITCVGGGSTTNTTAGIAIVNDMAGNITLAGPLISGLTISDYGYNGISIQGASGTSGFSGITIANNTVHDVTGNSTSALGTSCIQVFSGTGYGRGTTAPSHFNVTITKNLVYNCLGTAGQFNWSGSGILVSESMGVTIGGSPGAGNVAHDFGMNSNDRSGGPAGIWAADSANVRISYNEAYNGLHASGGKDGNGFGFDGGMLNSTMDHNYSHDNMGAGISLVNYNDGTCCANYGGIDVSWNITQNNQGGLVYGEVELDFSAPTTSAINIHNNTFSGQLTGYGIVRDARGTIASINVSNNIIIGATPVFLPSPGGTKFYNNDYYSYGQGFNVSWNGTAYTSLSAWQTATGQEKLSGISIGLTSNPSIYVPGGGWANGGYVPANLYAYNLQAGSPMTGAGLNIQSQFGINPGKTDYFGNAISAAALPVGAASGDLGIFVASCTPSSNYLARVSSFTKADQVNYNSLLCGLNADGNLAHLDFVHVLAAPNAAASLLNLVDTSYSLVSHGTVTFTARQGYTSDGTTGYLDTQYVPSSAAGKMTLASGSLGAYDLTGGIDSKSPIGATNNSTTDISIFVYTTTGAGPGMHGEVNDYTGSTCSNCFSNAKGMFAVQRNAGNDILWRNGVTPLTNTVAPVSLTPYSVFVLARDVAGTASSITTDKIAIDFLGDGSLAQASFALRANSFLMAYGANTY